MGNYHNMASRILHETSPYKINADFMHSIELLHLQQFPIEFDLSKIIHAFPHKILVIWMDT